MSGTIRFGRQKPKRPRHWSAFGEKERLYVLNVRDKHQCQIRGPHCEGWTNQVDHIVSKEDGGSDHRDNLQVACAKCNRRKWSASGDGSAFLANGNRRTKLPNISPPSRWAVIRADFSQRKAGDGGS